MEPLKHNCGVALIRLLKPLSFYERKYGTSRYGLEKLYLMMEKQHNRGQEGAGLAYVDLEAEVGTEYMFRERGRKVRMPSRRSSSGWKRRLTRSCTWATSVIPPLGRAGLPMSTLTCAATIGGRRIFACAAISI